MAKHSSSEIANREPPRPDMVTSVIEHEVTPGSEAEYEAWLKRITPLAERFPGYQGITVSGPSEGSSTFTLVLRFDSLEHAQNWFSSDTRRALIEEIQPYLARNEDIEITTGLEFWFKASPGNKQASPHKQFLVTLLVLYPLTMVIPALLGLSFEFAPALENPFVANLIVDAIIVGLLTYVLMPSVTRVLANWLFS